MAGFIKNIIHEIESSRHSLLFHFISFLAIITLRNLLECFSDHTPILATRFLHYYLAYTILALNIIILLRFFIKGEIQKLIRVVLGGFIFILLGPLLDLLLSWGGGYNISYFLPEVHTNIIQKFLTFFGGFEVSGVTPGIRIEIALILIALFTYVKLKTGSFLKSVFSVVAIYSLLFLYACLPLIIHLLVTGMGYNYSYSDTLMTYTYLLLLFILLILFYLIHNREILKGMVKDLRPFRILHYQMMFFLGILIYPLKISEIFIYPKNLLALMVMLAAILFACLTVIIMNNISDTHTDSANRRRNLLLAKTMSLAEYQRFGILALILMALYSLAMDFIVFFLLLCTVGNYFLYSMPPFRLKRIFFFSKLIISLNSVILVMTGFIFAGGDVFEFPYKIAFYFTLLLTFPIQFIDIKDYEGDKAEGIKTGPVVLGLKASKILIGLFFFLAYLLTPVILKINKILPFTAAAGAVQFFLINKRKYQEQWVFTAYLLGMAALLLYIMHLKAGGVEIILHKLLY